MSGEKRYVINMSEYVKLNVGGTLFCTTKSTLTKYDGMLNAMFSGRMDILTDEDGWVLIDRSGKHFGTVLNFLRDGEVALPKSQHELQELLNEAKYYLVQGLSELVLAQIKLTQDPQPKCCVPLITSAKEEQYIVNSTLKPVVKLLVNRHNNKYSYTSNSDDNLLRNIEMFDKLSLRFNGRVIFIKDVIGSQEICCWTYYGNGQKMAEVCCTSIVYGTDKKNTKVEFPEARILEETLNILLYEDRNSKPDDALMKATSRVPTGGTSCHSDDEDTSKPEKHAASNRRK